MNFIIWISFLALLIGIIDFLFKRISMMDSNQYLNALCIQIFSIFIPLTFFIATSSKYAINSISIRYSIFTGIIVGLLSIGIMKAFESISAPASIVMLSIKSLGLIILTLLCYIYFNETLSLRQWLGASLIMIGFFLVGVK